MTDTNEKPLALSPAMRRAMDFLERDGSLRAGDASTGTLAALVTRGLIREWDPNARCHWPATTPEQVLDEAYDMLQARDVQARVERGAAWLEAQGIDLAATIDLGQLDMRSPYACVAGQVFGRYVRIFDLSDAGYRLSTSAEAMELGLDVRGSRGQEYQLLEGEWTRVVLERRASA